MFLFRPRWLLLLGATTALVALFIALGMWQLNRLDQRRAHNDLIRQARQTEPVALDTLVSPNRREPPCRCIEYRRVRVTGNYDPDHQILVRNRTVDDRPGYFVLTPLITKNGAVVFVARGWSPPSNQGAHVAPVLKRPSREQVTVTGRIRLSEVDRLSKSGNRPTVQLGKYAAVTVIDLAQLGTLTDGPTYPAYLELMSQAPQPAESLALIQESPLDEGPHLSYAVQWFLFATIAVAGFGILAFREARNVRRRG